MIAATTVVGIDVSRDGLDGLCLPGEQRVRLANSAEGHAQLIAAIREMPGPVKVGFEGSEAKKSIRGIDFPNCGGQEWVLWAALVAADIDAAQLPPAQIKSFALSRGTRAKTDRIDAELITRFMLFRPEAGRRLPSENLRILRTLTTRRAQIVDMRKRLLAQIAARRKQAIPADVESMDDDLGTMLDAQIDNLERRIESVIAQEERSATKAKLLRSIPGIGPVSAAMLIAEMPELGRMTAGEAAAMTGLAPVPRASATRQWKDARQARNRRRSTRAATRAVPGRTCRSLSQSSSKTGRAAPQGTRQAAQAHHRRHRAQACHHRKRDPQNRHHVAGKPNHVDTVAKRTS